MILLWIRYKLHLIFELRVGYPIFNDQLDQLYELHLDQIIHRCNLNFEFLLCQVGLRLLRFECFTFKCTFVEHMVSILHLIFIHLGVKFVKLSQGQLSM